jgi:hypothetical protein
MQDVARVIQHRPFPDLIDEGRAMRLPRVRITVEWVTVPIRFSVRRMMTVVAILALVLGIAVLRHRRARYLELEKAHKRSAHAAALMQHLLVKEAEIDDLRVDKAPGRLAYEFADEAILSRSMVGYWSSKATYHEALSRKYEEAARRPWRLVSSDPPPPPNPLKP